MQTRHDITSDRGAILVHVAFGLLAVLAFTAFVVDYGVFWVSRRQAQNAADAGALAGAIALAFDNYSDRSDTGPAKESAYAASQANVVWGQSPSVIKASDVTFPLTPAVCKDSGSGVSNCVRVDAYRTVARSNPLPIFFGTLVGLASQDMQATATAQVAVGDATDCLKPWGVIDKWAEHWPKTADWTVTSTFDKYDSKGNLDPAITTPDVYTAPIEGDPGTGFHPYNADGSYTSDYGLELQLKVGSKNDFNYASGWFSALALLDSKGGKDYNENIKHCVGVTYTIGDQLPIDTEPGEMVGPTKQGVATDVDSLINQDPGATWDTSLNNGKGGVANSAFSTSPRIVAIPLVNPDVMADANKNGRASVPLANIAGFFVEGYDTSSKSVRGRLVTMPGLKASGAGSVAESSSFLRTVLLIR
jgi:Flp pilus assembly protein TadG